MATGYKEFNLMSPTSSSTINGILRVEYSYTQSLPNNTSTVTVTGIKFMSKNSYRTWFYANGRIKVGSLNIDFSNSGSNDGCYVDEQNVWYELGNNKTGGQFTVSHNADGTGSFTIQITYNPASYQSGDTTNFWIYCDFDWHGNGKNAVSLTATLNKINRQYTLSISTGIGSSIVVERSGTNLSNGATITYGDVLTITFAANTGYTLGSHIVNGSTFTSGNTHTVTGAVSVVSTATLKSFTLSISAGTNTTVIVNRTSSPLGSGTIGNISNGSTIYYNDVLTISFSVETGCTLSTHTVNGSVFTSGNTHTVTSAVTVVGSSTVNSYVLAINEGSNVTVTVNRTSSPKQGASQGYLSNGSTIYYGDVLSVSYLLSVGYEIETHTLNGSPFNSGDNYTVTANVIIVTTATVKSFSITETLDIGLTLVIRRTSSPNKGASTGILTENIAYYGDVLELSMLTDPGYGVDTMSINDTLYSDNPHTHTITSAIIIVATSKTLGFIYIDSGASIEKYRILIDSGSVMEQYRAMIDTGSSIVPY